MNAVVPSGWLAGHRRSIVLVLAVDLAILAVVVGLTLASGGFDSGVVAGGLALAFFAAMMTWFGLAIRGGGYHPQHAIYDAEFHAIQTDQQLMEPGPIRPRRANPELHITMAGIVVSLGVLMFVFAGI